MAAVGDQSDVATSGTGGPKRKRRVVSKPEVETSLAASDDGSPRQGKGKSCSKGKSKGKGKQSVWPQAAVGNEVMLKMLEMIASGQGAQCDRQATTNGGGAPQVVVGRPVPNANIRTSVRDAAVATVSRQDLLKCVHMCQEADGEADDEEMITVNIQIRAKERRALTLLTEAEVWLLRVAQKKIISSIRNVDKSRWPYLLESLPDDTTTGAQTSIKSLQATSTLGYIKNLKEFGQKATDFFAALEGKVVTPEDREKLPLGILTQKSMVEVLKSITAEPRLNLTLESCLTRLSLSALPTATFMNKCSRIELNHVISATLSLIRALDMSGFEIEDMAKVLLHVDNDPNFNIMMDMLNTLMNS